MNKIIYMALALVAASSLSGRAEVYTLEQCKEMALQNNADVKTAENNMISAIETRKEAFTKYFPEVSGGATYFKTNRDILQYTIPDLLTVGIIDHGKGAGVWALQPVFAGGQIVNGNRLAKVGEEVARIRQEQSSNSVLLQTEALYWQLVTLKSQKKTIESAIAMLDSLTCQVKVAVDAGVAMPNDLLKVELKRNGYRANLVDLDNGITPIKMLLSQQIGLGTDGNIDIPDTPTMPDMPGVGSDYMLPDEALPLTSDYRLLQKDVDAKALEKKMEVGKYLPQLGVGAGWFYHDLLEQNHNFVGFMVTLSVPISGWWGGSHAIKRKNVELLNARIQLDNLGEKLEIEMADKWNNVTAAHRKMALAAESIAQSRENLRLNTLYYEAGTSTITDLLDAQTLYSQSQSDYISAYGAFRLSQAQYLNATGRLH